MNAEKKGFLKRSFDAAKQVGEDAYYGFILPPPDEGWSRHLKVKATFSAGIGVACVAGGTLAASPAFAAAGLVFGGVAFLHFAGEGARVRKALEEKEAGNPKPVGP